MSLEQTTKQVKRALRKSPKTAAQLAESAGYTSGRAISRSIAALKADGSAVVVGGRPAKYAKA